MVGGGLVFPSALPSGALSLVSYPEHALHNGAHTFGAFQQSASQQKYDGRQFIVIDLCPADHITTCFLQVQPFISCCGMPFFFYCKLQAPIPLLSYESFLKPGLDIMAT